MTPLLIALIAAVAVALTIHSARRALAERNAVERHHRTLDVLGTLAERAERGERAEVAAPSAPVVATYQPRHRRSRPTRRRVPPTAAVGILGAVLVAVAAGWYLAARHQWRNLPGADTATADAGAHDAAIDNCRQPNPGRAPLE